MGSPFFKDHVPEQDALFVERTRAAGAIIIGKTNVPEFGYGSNSYNPIFGVTRNAWDPSKIGGGSSGGAGVALAMRMLPVADGSDMCGSLRNPAAYNNVYGFRPSQGRVPTEGIDPFFGQLVTDGPMGRSVADLAMLLSVQAGYDKRAPLSLDDVADWAAAAQPLAPSPLRLGWLGDFDGHLTFEPGVLELVKDAAGRFAVAGATIEPVPIEFDMEGLWKAFCVLRQYGIGGRLDEFWRDPERRHLLKPEAVWEVEQSHRLSALDVYKASVVRGAWYRYMMALFEQYDFLLTPSAQVFPFEAEINWPTEINGKKMDSYHRWMEVVVGATMAGCPSVSVPAGFSDKCLPMGMQIIGPPRADVRLLGVAATYEQLYPWLDRLPPVLSYSSESKVHYIETVPPSGRNV